jgi:23S rRNA (cytosine1962-C5)-methyltransferase
MFARLSDLARSLPPLPDRRLAIRLTADAHRQVRGGHPWIWADAITSVSDGSADPGTLAVVFDQKRQFAAIGLWDPNSPIRVRVLHAGKPVTIDADFWASRVQAACEVRDELAAEGTTGYRVIHGENDGFGGLVVDRYADTLVAKVYSEAWLPHLGAILEALHDQLQPERIVVRLGRLLANRPAAQRAELVDGVVVHGLEPHGPVQFLENELTFEADVLHGQKTGHFLDQRDNRLFLRTKSADAHVLDVFCCTGGFSVNAACGGAASVHSVDLSKHAIASVERNLSHNPAAAKGTRRSSTVGDAFEVMAQLGADRQRYDIVVVDPPSFASRASERDAAMRAYRKLTELSLPLLRPGGLLLQASCSSRITEDDLMYTVDAAVRSQGRELTDTLVTGHALDHPVSFPQGRYLKAIAAFVG